MLCYLLFRAVCFQKSHYFHRFKYQISRETPSLVFYCIQLVNCSNLSPENLSHLAQLHILLGLKWIWEDPIIYWMLFTVLHISCPQTAMTIKKIKHKHSASAVKGLSHQLSWLILVQWGWCWMWPTQRTWRALSRPPSALAAQPSLLLDAATRPSGLDGERTEGAEGKLQSWLPERKLWGAGGRPLLTDN